MKITWVLVNCNSLAEADRIGKKALEERLVSCFDVWPRMVARYFWPPKSGRIETAKGCTLVLETLNTHVRRLDALIRKTHSDKLPFIGSLSVGDIHPRYFNWIKGELK